MITQYLRVWWYWLLPIQIVRTTKRMQMIITFFPPSPSVYPARPKPPNPPVVTAYTSSSLTVEWTLLPGDTITAHVLQYKVSSSGQAYTDIDMDTPTDVTYTISGLLPYKEYAVRIIAVNSIGRSDPSDEVTATTGEAGMIHYHGFYIANFLFLSILYKEYHLFLKHCPSFERNQLIQIWKWQVLMSDLIYWVKAVMKFDRSIKFCSSFRLIPIESTTFSENLVSV